MAAKTKVKITKQFASKGLTMLEIFEKHNKPATPLKVVDYAFALPNKGKVKAKRLEGFFTIHKVGVYSEERGTYILTLVDSNGDYFTMLGEGDFITGMTTY